MKCKKCNADLGGFENEVASICLRPMGDEENRSYFLCKECDVYTAWICIEDFFTDKITEFTIGPIPRDKGDKIIDKIRKCPAPDNMLCRCPTHKEMER